MQKKLFKKLEGAEVTNNIFDNFKQSFLNKPSEVAQQ